MLKDILAISGYPGLYKLVAQNQKSIIVESLETKKRIPVYQTTKVSALEDIAIYTTDEEVPLVSIFEKIYTIENKGMCSVQKNASNNDIKEYFEDVLPDYDKDRVYISDMKKVLNWYAILHAQNMLQFDAKAKETSNESSETKEKTLDEVKPKAVAKAPKKTVVKQTAAPKNVKAPAAQKKSVPVKK
ncbi:MAG TPA: DUF5606 domain-containing protein [Bacteroidales bacterium]|jgi:hypothetical protein|nr:DUF5606 domain-containing protein [Bacteroidales bacterium]HRS18748.1 DUF5606 domain-containing protein [Bacteroidales bacterium]